ncbi:MAG: hypothetical protein QM772_10970 [Ottowia sp.]|uniref:hypothetical protein n=1 Tax=Ottowia sp. TaxID=1898956 RepID=UPI0039E5713D
MPAAEKAVPTSLKLPASVKHDIDEAARAAGVSPHAYMVDVLRKEAERARLREQFQRDALEALDEMQATGMGYDWDEVKDYLRARARDPQAPRPPLRPWR